MPSTVIAGFLYNAKTATLRINFVSGLIYEYKKVPERIFTAMQKAKSKGIFFNRYIKGHYDFSKVD